MYSFINLNTSMRTENELISVLSGTNLVRFETAHLDGKADRIFLGIRRRSDENAYTLARRNRASRWRPSASRLQFTYSKGRYS